MMDVLARMLGRRPPDESAAPGAPSFLSNQWNLDAPLVYLSQADPWTIRDACAGTAIFGATGSGKTSGSGQAIAKAFLRAGFGGLVLCAKPDERELWQRYAEQTGRAEDLAIFSPQNPWRFNFLDYELRRPGAGAGLTENLVNLFIAVLETSERKGGSTGNQDYWNRALKQLLRNAIDVIVMARDTLTLPDIYEVIVSAPQSEDDLADSGWWEKSACGIYLAHAGKRAAALGRMNDYEMAAKFWTHEFPRHDERTRSNIVSTFTSMADCFLRGTLRELFCTTTNLIPELTHEGAILIVDLPVKEFNELGQFAQVLWKYLWQRATERRRDPDRPVFLWADEVQYFATSHDMLFQTTARSARAATVYLTQNIHNLYAVLGGEGRARSETESLLGNLQTKIFHANADHGTNQWAAEIIGRDWQTRTSFNVGDGDSGKFGDVLRQHSQNHSASTSQHLEYVVQPRAFTTLRTGGPPNGCMVDGIVFQAGRMWSTGRTHLQTAFHQNG